MDRDKRWERVKIAYDLLVQGKGKQATDMVKAMQESYDSDSLEHKELMNL
jgi:2,3-bisphosphoglycerate-independent phosphoglycerate mutase